MVFLMETKIRHKKMEMIKCKIGFSNVFAVDCVGRSGGLGLLWNKKAGLEIQNISRRHINATISDSKGVIV